MTSHGLEYYLVNRPKPGESVSGDTGIIELSDDQLFACLIDVAGHGEAAHDLAMNCNKLIQNHSNRNDLKSIVGMLHRELQRQRGVVLGLCTLDLNTNELQYLGVGNIYARIFSAGQGGSLINCSGLVGQNLPGLRIEYKLFNSGDVLVLCSDGVSTHALNELVMDSFQADTGEIAQQLVRDFGKSTDDASCIVMRNKGQL